MERPYAVHLGVYSHKHCGYGQSEKEKATIVKIIEEFKDNIKDNIWIDNFLQCDMYEKN